MPLLIPLVVPFFAIAAAIVLAGLAKTHTATSGSQTSTGFWQFLSSGLLKTLFGEVAQIGRALVSRFAAAQLNVVAKWLLAMGTLTLGWFGISASFAEEIVSAVERVEHGVTQAIHSVTRAEARLQKTLTREIHVVERETAHVAHSLTKYEAKVNTEVRRLDHAITVTLPHEVARVRGAEDALSRDIAKLKERTRSLEDGAVDTWEWIRTHPLTGVTGAFAGAVAIALARLGFGFMRCRNWQQVGKNLTCGMGAWVLKLLELIAGFGLAIFSVLDPEALAQEAVSLVDTVEPLLSEILKN